MNALKGHCFLFGRLRLITIVFLFHFVVASVLSDLRDLSLHLVLWLYNVSGVKLQLQALQRWKLGFGGSSLVIAWMEPELVLGGGCDPVFQSLISFHLDAVFNPLWPSEEACEDNCILGCHMYRSRYLLLNVLPKLNPEKYYNRQIPKGITHLILFTPKPIFNVS